MIVQYFWQLKELNLSKTYTFLTLNALILNCKLKNYPCCLEKVANMSSFGSTNGPLELVLEE